MIHTAKMLVNHWQHEGLLNKGGPRSFDAGGDRRECAYSTCNGELTYIDGNKAEVSEERLTMYFELLQRWCILRLSLIGPHGKVKTPCLPCAQESTEDDGTQTFEAPIHGAEISIMNSPLYTISYQ